MLKKSLVQIVIFSQLMTSVSPLWASGPGQKLPLVETERAGPSMLRLAPLRSSTASSGRTEAQFSWEDDEEDDGTCAASASIPSKGDAQLQALCNMWNSGGKNRDLIRSAVLEAAQNEGPHHQEALPLLRTSDDPEDQQFVLALTGHRGGFPLETVPNALRESVLCTFNEEFHHSPNNPLSNLFKTRF